ncbi:MAG: hypothetical protein IJS67_02595, partial [Clostridia bacterium]|nr:hypothetical protein [Clostridia bacterium]
MVGIDKNIFNFKLVLNEQRKLIKSSKSPETSWELDRSRLFDRSFHRIWIILSGNGVVTTNSGELNISENNVYYLPPYSIVATKLLSDMEQYYIDFIQDVSKTPLSQLYEFNFTDETNSFDVILGLAKS